MISVKKAQKEYKKKIATVKKNVIKHIDSMIDFELAELMQGKCIRVYVSEITSTLGDEFEDIYFNEREKIDDYVIEKYRGAGWCVKKLDQKTAGERITISILPSLR